MNAKYIILFACILFSITKLKSQEDKYPETVLIRVIETTYGDRTLLDKLESKLIIIKPDNSVETKLLKEATYTKANTTDLEDNLVKIRIELQLWQNQGFHVQSMTSAPADVHSTALQLTITTFVLTKN